MQSLTGRVRLNYANATLSSSVNKHQRSLKQVLGIWYIVAAGDFTFTNVVSTHIVCHFLGQNVRDLTVFHVISHQGYSIIKKGKTRKPHASQHRPGCCDFLLSELMEWQTCYGISVSLMYCSSFGNNTG